MMLQDNDSLYVYSIDQMKRKKFVYIDGEVERPGKYPLYDNMNLADLIFLAGDLKKNAYQLGFELARLDSLGRVQIQYIDIPHRKPEQVALQEDDRVFIRKMPDWFLHRMVTVDGEVRFPGQYALISRNETLYDIIQRAGGFTERAFVKGAIFRRKSIEQNLENRNLPEIIANSQPLEQDSTGRIYKAEIVNFKLNNMNRIVLDMEKIISSKGENGNVTMQNGDMVFIPEIPTGISVMGAVGSNGTIKFEQGKNVNYYLKRAGNFTKQACKRETKLIKADGQVFSGSGTMNKRVDVGDAIVVPTEIKKDRDWLRTMSAAISIIGGVMTSVFIIDKL
jgi:protein involved in polysaccharide export with SLBB domain